MWISLILSLVAAAAPLHATTGDIKIERAFPNHPVWKRPVWLGPMDSSSNWHAMVEQRGIIHVFQINKSGKASDPQLFLDLEGDVSREGNEEGLIGLAFHPEFEKNRRFYVHYSVGGDKRGRLSEFLAHEDDLRTADIDSEKVLLEVKQPWRNHNGGDIQFGPDGMLYMVLGDGGAANDPKRNAQNLSTLLGTILRIDVNVPEDSEETYLIPKDNPFVDTEGARGEIWAIGLRNAWRFCFDPKTDLMWTGDVGQDKWEEVDVVVKGGNYGWPLREGAHSFRREDKPGPGKLIEPVAEYGRKDGISITGGFVYRGKRIPALKGRYLYADYQSGHVWSIDADITDELQEGVLIGECPSPASFGIDRRGELYITSFDGRIYRIARG
jgi:glucose/arabinose dehydrogenase